MYIELNYCKFLREHAMKTIIFKKKKNEGINNQEQLF